MYRRVVSMDLKIESYIKDMERRGIKGYLIAPPVFRLLWCFGLKVRPPLFNSFASNFIIFGFFWSIVVGCIEYAYDLIFSVSPHEPQLALAIFTGVAMGLL